MAQNSSRDAELEASLKRASGQAIRDTIPHLVEHWQAKSWLGQSNAYREDPVQRLKDNDVKHDDLSEYVAASAIAHCFDGWSYLGRALEAEIAGDPNAARHLGYYSELRAAMSLLASGGIGVFNRKHVVVESNRCCKVIKGYVTHVFVWKALEIWIGLSAGSDSIRNSVAPGSIPLTDWLEQFNAGSDFVPEAWRTQWGLDLSRLAEDKDARNNASYRPTAFTSPSPRSIESTMRGILRLWELCDPGTSGGFPVLDSHLLRTCVHMIWQQRKSRDDSDSYRQHLDGVLAAISPKSCPAGQWEEFLSHERLCDHHELIVDARGRKTPLDKDHSKQVLARATLLLRISTGCVAHLLEETELNGSSGLEFWSGGPSVRRRLWPESSPVESSVDLWTDVEDASESIEQWLDRDENGLSLSSHAMWTEQAAAAATLTTTERAFLWGAGL